ncbi:MAG: PilZ domain-containing protein [Phycisphaerales bacterium]
MSNMYVNRRREARYHCLHDPMTWQVETHARRPGSLLDISYSGLAFETEYRHPLRIGSTVNLVRRCDRGPMLCQIVSLEKQSDNRWRAGCKRLSPASVLANRSDRPQPRLAQHIRQPALQFSRGT